MAMRTDGRAAAVRRGAAQRAVRLTAIALAAAGLPLGAAAPAHAGLFKITQCHDELTVPDDVVDGFFQPIGMTVVNRCANGSLELTPPGNAIAPSGSPGQAAGFRWVIPSTMPNTVFSSAWVNLSIAAKSGSGNGNAYVGNASAGGTQLGPSKLEVPPGAWGGIAGWGWEADAPAEGTTAIATTIQCGATCTFDPGPVMSIYRATLELSESTLPTIPATPTTGLLDGTAQRGIRTLRVSAADADSGVTKIELHGPDGSVLATASEGASCRYDRPGPCPQATGPLDLAVDTTQLADGPQTLEVWVFDAAGNIRKTQLASITVANRTSPAPVPNGSGGDRTSAVLSVAAKQTSITTTAGHHLTIAGRLVDGAGQPITGAQVDVLQTLALPGAAATKVGTVVTDGSGGYTYSPITTGSRAITFAYASALGSTDYATRATATLRARATVSLTMSSRSVRRHRPVTFSGKLGVDPLPTAGARLVIEGKVPGSKRWLTAAIVRTRKGGAYSWTHSFTTAAAWTFRTRVLGASDLDAVPGHSASALLRVR